MKKLTALLIFCIPMFISAQSFIDVQESTYSVLTENKETVFKVEVQRVKKEDFMDHWEDFIEDQSDLKVERADYAMSVKEAILKKVSSVKVNIYMFFEDMEDGTRVYMAFEDIDGKFIGPNHTQYGIKLKELISQESKKVFVMSKKEDLGAEEKHLAELEKSLAKIKKEQDKINRQILSSKRDIENYQQDIIIFKGLQEDLISEVSRKHSALNSLGVNATDDERKAARKELKNAEKKRDKMSKKIDKSGSNIFKVETEIRELQYDLEKLAQDEQFASDKIHKQREVVLMLKDEVYQLKR